MAPKKCKYRYFKECTLYGGDCQEHDYCPIKDDMYSE